MTTACNKIQGTQTFKCAFPSVFHYATFSEQNFKRNKKQMCGYESFTTFMSDLSIAEWCEVYMHEEGAVEDTIKRALEGWWHDPKYIAELLMAVNSKSWEHNAMCEDKYASMRCFTEERHSEWQKYWTDRYYTLLDEVMDHYEEDEDTKSLIYGIID